MGEKCKAGSLVSEVFKREGVKYVFGIPGGHIYPMMEGCEERGIKFIGVRHEMTAAFMAEGWALTTGEVGVCTGTAGPGFTNMVTGMANAFIGGYPVLYFAGKARVTENDRNELQDFNQMDIVKTMTKHARSVSEVKRIPEYVGRAIAHATTGRPGPVYLEIPRDLMDTDVEVSDVEFQETYRTKGTLLGETEKIEKAAKLIKESNKPVVIAGAGVWWSQAHQELNEFIDKSGIPLFTRNAARGAVPDSHDLYMNVGYNHPVTATALAEADLAIIIGTRPGYTMPKSMFSKDIKIIRIDIDPAELTNQLDITLGIVGDAKGVLKQLTNAIEQSSYPEWVGFIETANNQLKEIAMQMAASNQEPINPMRLITELAMRVDENTIVVLDGGDVATWGTLVMPATGPGQFLSIANNSFGPLGVGMGYAMAAKLAHPVKKVILLTGDGTFGYGAMEYDTCMRYGINITTVILNDKMWGMIKRAEAQKSSPDKEFVGLDLQEVHYEKIVEAIGGYGEFVTKPGDLGPAIDRALASEKPSCVNVMTDPNVGPPRG